MTIPTVREVLGRTLREYRIARGMTLRQVSRSAQVSLGYLSELERGRKEASSELVQAIAVALNVPLSQVYARVSHYLADAEQVSTDLAA